MRRSAIFSSKDPRSKRMRSIRFERALVQGDGVFVRVHAARGVAGERIVANRPLRVAGRPRVIGELFDRSFPIGGAFQRERDRTMKRLQLRGEKVAVDRVACEPVTKPEQFRRELFDDLYVACVPKRRKHVIRVGTHRAREKIEAKRAADDGRMRDDASLTRREGVKTFQQRRPNRLRERADAGAVLGIVALDGAFEQLLGEERISLTRACDRATCLVRQRHAGEGFVDERSELESGEGR
jgi:hypothetical protein